MGAVCVQIMDYSIHNPHRSHSPFPISLLPIPSHAISYPLILLAIGNSYSGPSRKCLGVWETPHGHGGDVQTPQTSARSLSAGGQDQTWSLWRCEAVSLPAVPATSVHICLGTGVHPMSPFICHAHFEVCGINWCVKEAKSEQN